MPLALILLILVAVASLSAAVYVIVSERARMAIVRRTQGQGASVVLPTPRQAAQHPPLIAETMRRVTSIVPRDWTWNTRTEQRLVQAGYDSDLAPLMYGGIRVLLLLAFPLVALLVAPRTAFDTFVLCVAGAAIIALIIPVLWLTRAVRIRQEKIRRSLPDALDLIVVCIDAGISLDAAILRVAKELGAAHPELADELLVVNRKTNAGVSRADALTGLWTRTGVQEVRALVSHVVQSDKWGTSSGKVLRVYASTLRRQRRQSAEKKAATAPVKMLVPLGLCIFPALLLVILGPVIINVMTLFK